MVLSQIVVEVELRRTARGSCSAPLQESALRNIPLSLCHHELTPQIYKTTGTHPTALERIH